ncbi:hypothetical protein GOV12_01750 [Candidatus Pacearchaeota archaeon]|nr:hypothetical protein [Candidatus Pacearchaeota archaeon]
MKTKKTIIILVIVVLLIIGGIFLFSSINNNSNSFFLDENELKSIGIQVSKVGEIMDDTVGEGPPYIESSLYEIRDSESSFYIMIYRDESLDRRNDGYDRLYNDDNKFFISIMEKDTHGEKSFIRESETREGLIYSLYFVKSYHTVTISGNKEIGLDKIKAIGKLVENKISS